MKDDDDDDVSMMTIMSFVRRASLPGLWTTSGNCVATADDMLFLYPSLLVSGQFSSG